MLTFSRQPKYQKHGAPPIQIPVRRITTTPVIAGPLQFFSTNMALLRRWPRGVL
jgi:hypothetical protein